MTAGARCYVAGVKLADCIAQCHSPLVVQGRTDKGPTVLSDAADFAGAVARCPLRYVLSDELTRLCADLAYSRGAGTVACADLLHVPAQTLWVEWCNEPWKSALAHYGIPLGSGQWVGRRGALIRSSSDGRRGLVRTFWNVSSGGDVRASSVEAYLDFDTAQGEEPEPLDCEPGRAGRVCDSVRPADDVLGRCCRFRYERSWSEYYRRAKLTELEDRTVWRHSLGTIVMDIPMLLAFFLLLATRSGLPQRPQELERLNRQRLRSGKVPLLDHVEVRAPVLPEYRDDRRAEARATRASPRLHHVRGHLMRRGNELFWRVPHLRGSVRSGVVRTRTVVWTFDRAVSATRCPDTSRSLRGTASGR
jgi:hypothetical protein